MHSPVSKSRITSLFILAAVAALDQWSKAAVFEMARSGGIPREILPIFNLVLVKNRGISFGMFAKDQPWIPFMLTLLTSAIVVALAVWLARARDRATAIALGIIVGGAIGNIVDRVRLGAVTDFLDFHLQNYHWPAFNLADSAVFIGVVILVLIGIVSPANEKEKET